MDFKGKALRKNTLSQNVTTLSLHNSDIHELILIIFGKNVTEEVFVSDIAIFVLKRDVKLQLTNY